MAACREPRYHHYTPGAGPARAAGGDRGQDGPRLGPAASRRARCWSPTAASTPSSRPSPPCSTRATRSCCRRPTGSPTPRRSRSPGPSRWSWRPASRPASGSRSSSWRRPPPTGPSCWCSSPPPTRPAPCTRADEVEAIGRWAAGRGLWVLTDEIYEHLVYGSAEFTSMPVVVPELADRCVVVNGVAKTYAMTGWRVGWLIGPPDVVSAATNLQSHATSNVANVSQAAALAAVSGDLRGRGRDADRLRPAAAQDGGAAAGHPRGHLRRAARAPSTPSRRSRRCWAGSCGASGRRPAWSWPT